MKHGERSGAPRSKNASVRATEVPNGEILSEIIVHGNVERLVEWARRVGKGLATNEELTTSQVRSFFGEVRQIEARVLRESKDLPADLHRRLFLLKPKLEYQAKRMQESKKSEGVARLRDVLSPAIDLVEKDANRFRHLVDFFEAILAYHKAAGGRDR